MAAKLPPLDQIDPSEAWKPWQPSSADPWGRKWAAHLYRRAAFGPSRVDLLESERLGFQGTLALLLQGKPREEYWEQTLADAGRIAVAPANRSCEAGGSIACCTAAIRCARSSP